MALGPPLLTGISLGAAHIAHQQLVCVFRGGRMNLTKFEDIFNLTERLREEAENSPDTGDEFGYWTEGVLLVLRLVLNATSFMLFH